MSAAKYFCLAASVALVAGFQKNATASDMLWDKPVRTVKLALPPDPDNPQARPALSCFYFRHFVVKQIDLGEIGADQLSIIPLAKSAAAQPDCRRQNAGNERVVSPKDWTGYFRGAKGDYVFFDAEDGWNDGLGFAVFTPAANKLFEDAAKKFRNVATTPSSIALEYERVYGAKCSLRADKSHCWTAIKKDTGLSGDAPDCSQAYAKEMKRTPDHAKQVIGDPTVVDYEALATVSGRSVAIAPVTGKALRCRPAD